ncbi:hypothetical protein BKA69DRAFT_1125055 [Paraphysoderma sedebokerense]|nr:hypothetical protein BKA69DRAFT_1125055 [Paraphysoderma sedebokerense]
MLSASLTRFTDFQYHRKGEKCYILRLNDSILTHIFKYIDDKSIIQCTAVCQKFFQLTILKKWRSYNKLRYPQIVSDPVQDFKIFSTCLIDAPLNRPYYHYIQEINLEWITVTPHVFNADIMPLFLHHISKCRNLRRIGFPSLNVGETIIHKLFPHITDRLLQKLLEIPYLQYLSICFIDLSTLGANLLDPKKKAAWLRIDEVRLKHLHIDNVSSLMLKYILSTCPNIKEVGVGYRHYKHATRAVFSPQDWANLLSNCQLSRIDLGNVEFRSLCTPPFLVDLAYGPTITSLSLVVDYYYTSEILSWLFSTLPNLVQLDLTHQQNPKPIYPQSVDSFDLSSCRKVLSTLRSLKLTGRFTNLAEIIEHGINIETLALSNLTSNDWFDLDSFNNHPSLKSIELHNCTFDSYCTIDFSFLIISNHQVQELRLFNALIDYASLFESIESYPRCLYIHTDNIHVTNSVFSYIKEELPRLVRKHRNYSFAQFTFAFPSQHAALLGFDLAKWGEKNPDVALGISFREVN